MNCSLSGAPAWARLTTARAERALNAPAGDRWRGSSRCSVVHRTVRCTPDSPVNYSGAASIKFPRLASSGGRASLEHRTVRCTPDSPVNYSGAPPEIPEGSEFELESSGAPDTVRCTPDSPVLPDQRAFGCHFCSFIESKTWSFYWLSVNLLYLYNLYTWAN
jgi:hypothetical protein